MKTKGKNKHNYVDALETEHLYAVLTKQGRIQILIQPINSATKRHVPQECAIVRPAPID